MHILRPLAPLLLLLAVITAGAHAETTVRAVARASTDLSLGPAVGGRVMEVLVAEGDAVEPGQILVRLDDREPRARVRLLESRAENDVAVRSARASLALARNEEASVRRAAEGGGANEFEVRRAELTTTQSELALERAEREHREAAVTLEQARIALDQYAVRAPSAGVVEAISVEPGEPVRELTPVVRVVQIDPLEIDVPAPTRLTYALRPGRSLPVVLDDEAARVDAQGTITSIAGVADAASGTRTIRLRVPNPRRVPAGVPVSVVLPETPPAADGPG